MTPRALALATAVLGAASVIPQAQQFGASRIALATVADIRGRALVDIEADDFVVRESGQAREVLSVRVADYPIVLVLDNGAGAGDDFAAIRDAAARFIGRVGRRPIAVTLASPPRLIANFDDERAVVTRALSGASAAATDAGLFEAIVAGARAISDNGSPFSAIVVVSAGPRSAVPEELLAPVLASGAAVHVVVTGSGGAGSRPVDALRAVADQTRGQFTTIFSAASYQVALDRLADRLAPQLLVEYVVPAGSSSGNDVQLGVRIPGARVIAWGVK